MCAKNCWSLDPLTSGRLLSQVSLFFSLLSYKEASSQKKKLQTYFVTFSNTTVLYFLMHIGEIIGNLPNKECEGARGDILMDIGPSIGYLHQP